MSTFRLALELVRYRPCMFAASLVLWTAVHASPIAFGLLIGQVFDRLSGEAPAGAGVWTPVVVFAALAIGRNGVIWLAEMRWIRLWNEQGLQLRRNLLGWLLEAPGARVIPSSPGEAVSTFRDDVDDLLEYVENWVDMGGLIVFGFGSVVVMARIDAGLTGLVLIPLVLTATITQALGPQIRRRRKAMRAATERVTGFIGETFGAVQSVKLHRAEGLMLDQFRRLNADRRRAALADTVLTELLRSVNRNMSIIGVALVLLVAAGSVGAEGLTIGELAVFLTFMPRLTDYMAFFGDIIAQHRRTGVAYERIRALAVDAPHEVLLDRTRVRLNGDLDTAASEPVTGGFEPLDRLEVRDLAFSHADGGMGLVGVDFVVERGSFTVVTGRIGSGKTTLARALLGLLPSTGEIRWNGRLVEDPAWFFVPPRSAYTPQVPRLFSETLEDNIALGQRATRERLREAVQLAVLDRDLERLEQGMETLVGARGVKLSGGQVQRSAAARMFATGAELLVFDDLSSALDVDTEARLWDRLFERRDVTCVVVSHRRAALLRADQILLMDGGRIVDRGPLDDLLERSPLMRELWEEES